MLRDNLAGRTIGMDPHFRYRGKETGRLENFSDAVFALAITLLLISTSPPKSFSEIERFVWDIIPFTLCITVIILIWHEHFQFFFRYGLRHGRIIVYNTLFLILVLFYVYPLKFLTKQILIPLGMLFDQPQLLEGFSDAIKPGQMPSLMIIYGVGFALIFLILSRMYAAALAHSRELELDDVELFDTRMSVQRNLLMATVPVASVLVAILLRKTVWAGGASGFVYWIYFPLMMAWGSRMQKKRNALLATKGTAAGPDIETSRVPSETLEAVRENEE